MSAEHPNEVDPLPPLQLLSSVVEPIEGYQYDLRARPNQPYQLQQQQATHGVQRSQHQRQQHAGRHVPGRGAARTRNPITATADDYAVATSSGAAAGSSAAAAAGGYVPAGSRTAAGYTGPAVSTAAGAGAHARSHSAIRQQQQHFNPQQHYHPQPPPRSGPLSLPQQQYHQQYSWEQQLGSLPSQQGGVPRQRRNSPPGPSQRRSPTQHSSPPRPPPEQQQGTRSQQGSTPEHQDSPAQSSPTGTDGSGNGEHSSGSNRLPDSPEGPDIVKVSHRSRISAVAGKIAHDVRDGRLPRVMVVGNPSIANATKAIAQARRYLRPEGMDIAFTPHFRTEDHSRALLELSIVLIPFERGTAADHLASLDNAGGHEARIAIHSRHARIGSGTARQLISRGISVLCSVGNDALANSVMATAHAACFLVDTGRQMVVQPTHVLLRRDNGRGLHRELHSYKLVVMFAN